LKVGSKKDGGLGKLPDTFEEGGYASALLPKPGGTIVYYRID
jgi:hypothetical protein